MIFLVKQWPVFGPYSVILYQPCLPFCFDLVCVHVLSLSSFTGKQVGRNQQDSCVAGTEGHRAT